MGVSGDTINSTMVVVDYVLQLVATNSCTCRFFFRPLEVVPKGVPEHRSVNAE